MSIELAAADQITPGAVAFMAIIALLAMAILRAVGFFSTRDELSIERLTPPETIGPLMINAGVAVVVFMGASIVMGAVLHATDPEAAKDMATKGLSPTWLIAISCAAPIASLVWMLFGLKWMVPNGYRQIGLDELPQSQNALAGLGIVVAALPTIMVASEIAERLYQHFGLVHEDAHELLKSMGEVGGGWERAMAIFAAVVLAPLNEEILFRGHIQSAIRRVLMPRPGVLLAEAIAVAVDPSLMPPPLPMEYESATPPPFAKNNGTAGPAVEHVTPPAGPRTFIASAGAVLITSVIFSAIHPMWSWPPIFVLSLFLGIAYERRGNLWTSIFVHALFNGAMITAYLSMQHPGT